MALQILTTLWGKKHVDLFKEAALKSLSWKDNLNALQEAGAIWNIFADDEFHSEIQGSMPAGIFFNIKSTTTLRDYIDQIQSACIWQIKECIDKKQKLLLAPPDTIFGEGTIRNLFALGDDRYSCVVVPHPRVLPSILPVLDSEVRNKELVSLAFKHLHKSWTDAEKGHPIQSSYIGGVEWERLEDGLFSITHRLPTPYLVDFTDEDLQYFKSASSFGSFDHKWAGDILIHRQRQRYCGSSDACFIVEVTEHEKNVPEIIDGAPKRGFRYAWPHNQANAQITAIWRG